MSARGARDPQPSWDRPLELGLAAIAVLAPLAIGGAPTSAQIALSAGALALTAWYVIGVRGARGVRRVPFTLVAALGVAWTLAQLIVLPTPLVAALSPHAAALRAEVGAHWLAPLSLDVPATCLALVRGLACLGLLVTVAGFARSMARARALLFTLAILGGALGLLSFAQRLCGAHAILGLYHPRSTPGSGYFATFVDGNHAASLFSLTALVALGLAVELKDGRRFLSLVCATISIAALLSTASRSGAAGLAVGGFLFAAVLLSRRLGRLRGLIAAGLLLVIGVSAILWSADALRSRLSFDAPEQLVVNQKTRGWRDALSLIAAYPLTGVGRGAFEAPMAAYRRADEGVRLVYPENLLVELASEWGVPVTAALLVLAFLSTGAVARRMGRLEPSVLAAAAGVVAVLVHELGDFALELPGVAFPTVIALGIVVARAEERGQGDRSKRPRLPLGATVPVLAGWAIALLVGGGWAARHTLDADFTRVETALRAHATDTGELARAAIARHPAAASLELLAAESAAQAGSPAALRHINRALRLHPADFQGHRLAALLLSRIGHHDQAALEYRLACERGMAPSYAELLRLADKSALDAVVQRPEALLALGDYLAAHGRPELADAAGARAVDLSGQSELALRGRLRIDLATHSSALVARGTAAIEAANPSAAAWAAAADALSRAGLEDAAAHALSRGMKAHPGDASLVLLAARQQLRRNDLVGARALLRRNVDGNFSLREREQAEELLAQIADRSGDPEEGVLARSRARLLARRLGDSVDNSTYRKALP